VDSARLYAITRPESKRVGVMAWLADGRTAQFVPETGEFHDNPALSDDLVNEQYNTYQALTPEEAQTFIRRLTPFPSATLAWLVERFAAQPAGSRFAAERLGLTSAGDIGQAAPRPHEVSPAEALPPVHWLRDVLDPDSRTPDVVQSTVATLLGRGLAEEPRITSDLLHASTPGTLLGLEHRIKSPTSLVRKVDMWFWARTPTATILKPLEIVSSIPDVVRYTLVARKHDDLLLNAQSAAAGLYERGHRIVVAEHSYLDGNFYKGFKSYWEAPTGQLWELQFRSELNVHFKDRAYPHYKASRDLARSIDERRASLAESARIYSELPAPAGLDQNPTLAGTPVRARVYVSPL